MRCPAGESGHNKYRGKKFGRDAHEMVGGCMKEVCVAKQAFLTPHDFLTAHGNWIQHRITYRIRELFRPLLDDHMTRVLFQLDCMAKTHDFFFAR